MKKSSIQEVFENNRDLLNRVKNAKDIKRYYIDDGDILLTRIGDTNNAVSIKLDEYMSVDLNDKGKIVGFCIMDFKKWNKMASSFKEEKIRTVDSIATASLGSMALAF